MSEQYQDPAERRPSISRSEEAPSESRMIINPQGARIELLNLGGREIFKALTRGDGKAASTHPCTPVFGPETITSFGLSQHGPMRNDLTEVIKNDANNVELRYIIDSGTYPFGMQVEQVFSLAGKSFTLETTHTNNGKEAAPVNFGEHFYWLAQKGWKGLTVNGEDVTNAVENDLVIPLNSRNIIVIPGQEEIVLEQEGMPYANLWVYRDENTGKYDQHYVCIEPVEGDPTKDSFGSKGSYINPGSSRKTSVTISV